MTNYYYDTYTPEEELRSLPKTYTKQMAQNNNDIMIDNVLTYNEDRFYQFIWHVQMGIPDKIRIAKYGIDGPVEISIIIFDGNTIKIIADVSRFGQDGFLYFIGDKIMINAEERLGEPLIAYYLITSDGNYIEIFRELSRTKDIKRTYS